MKTTATNDIYLLLIRAAMGEHLDEEESVLLKEFLDNRKQ